MDHGMIESPGPRTHRIETLDVVRGFALLGILGPNMLSFAWPEQAMWSHEAIAMSMELLGTGPADEEANRIGHLAVALFFHGKMMFLFSLLFGAGAVLFARKFDAPGSRLSAGAGLWYRRMAWLLGVGLCHGIFFWYGDILLFYAVIGMGAIWWVRRWSPGTLAAVGWVVFAAASLLMVAFMVMGVWAHEAGHEDMFAHMSASIVAYRGGYFSVMPVRLISLAMMVFVLLPFFFFWIGTGIMMMGMALMKWGFLTGQWSRRAYAATAAAGLVTGLGLTGLALWGIGMVESEASGMIFLGGGQLVGVPTAIGYAALLILLVKMGLLRWPTTALAAVGRMALSNYLLQTFICTTLFYGYGFGLFARVEYVGMAGIMVGVWCVNILFSLVWLRCFRFGPAEWAWRCLTYWRLLPIRRTSDAPAEG